MGSAELQLIGEWKKNAGAHRQLVVSAALIRSHSIALIVRRPVYNTGEEV
jgi:hypothetical protein